MPFLTGGRWFPTKKGTVTAVTIAGFGAAAFFFNLLDMQLVNPQEINPIAGRFPPEVYARLPSLLRWLALIYGVLVVGGALLQSNPPSYVASSQSAGLKASPARPLLSDLLSIRFATMWLMIFASATPGLNIAGSFKIYGLSRPSLNSDAFLTLVGSLSALLGNAGGRLFWGSITDAAGFKGPFIALALVEALVMINFQAFTHSRIAFAFATTIMLFCMGGNFAMFPPETHRAFGANGTLVYGILYTAFASAALTGPIMSKALIAMGGYDLVFIAFGSLPLISALLAVSLCRR
jgi:OFA family oxalate/formate antiporter-like MFS transporter